MNNFVDAGVFGADVSFWQDDNATAQKIDFSKMVAQGASFVIIRAGQNKWIDPDFVDNWANSKNKLPRGAYWFYDSRVDPESQADLFASCFTDKEELELWADFEDNYLGSYNGWSFWKRFLERLKAKRPQSRIGIYTSYGYFQGKIPSTEYQYFGSYPLWLASYNPIENVMIPAPWTKCLYWQWGTPPVGKEWGCESTEIDMNKFNGTMQEFSNRYGISAPPPTGETMYYGTVIAPSGLNVRKAPVSTAEKLFAMPYNTKIEADRIENKWWHLKRIDGQPVTQEAWSFEGDTSGYIRLDQAPPPSEMPAYFISFDANGKELGKYIRE